ncbi:hypothetical protein Pse7367_1262 [Thalassoporum mexicanum PCC 7367]|uniref:chlororespiratory reduction protein 7 n=1 Tax=Thalassoporum mexicanum TaxID=3457544 RepID=UPI00029FF478|nr:chlororespiratory reduction protein 7 [Pseudanabaena sp. PCC 7367]AFY69556.1 hypothetical protein Pse7367_1262 [Pseudanabaena sp. PCC 7367]
MPDAMMYYQDNYVMLSPTMEQEFLTPPELRQKLSDLLANMQDQLPRDLQKFDRLEAQVDCLIDTACELEVEDQGTWQWYVVRLDK